MPKSKSRHKWSSNYFALEENNTYGRGRHSDLQALFKNNAVLTAQKREVLESLRETLDILGAAFETTNILTNRAIIVSTVLLAWAEKVKAASEAEQLASFMEELTW